MPPLVTVPVQVELAKVFGPAITDLASGETSFPLILAKVTSNFEARKTVHLMQTVFEHMSCDGKNLDFESHFVGKNVEMWQAFIFGLEVNYADLLEAIQSGFVVSVQRTEQDLDIVDAP